MTNKLKYVYEYIKYHKKISIYYNITKGNATHQVPRH